MRPDALIVDATGRPTRALLAAIPGLRPHDIASIQGRPSESFLRAWRAAFGQALEVERIEVGGIATRAFREKILAVGA